MLFAFPEPCFFDNVADFVDINNAAYGPKLMSGKPKDYT